MYLLKILLLAIAAICFAGAAPVLAKPKQAPAAQPAPSAQKPPAIEPEALALVKAMSDKLAEAKSIAFVATGAFDVPARNGHPLFYTTRSEVLLVRPDKLRVTVPGDGPPSEFYFDGKKITMFQPYSDFIASAEMPGTLDEALDNIYEKAGIYFPFVDFIVANPYKTLTEGLKSAFVIGKSKVVGGTTTDILALSDANVHMQLWIGEEDKLPRLVWITAAGQSKQPRHMVEFSDWRLAGEIPEDTKFAPKTTESTKEIPFARPDAPTAMPPAKPKKHK